MFHGFLCAIYITSSLGHYLALFDAAWVVDGLHLLLLFLPLQLWLQYLFVVFESFPRLNDSNPTATKLCEDGSLEKLNIFQINLID